jgi:hypothetical protein
MNRLSLLALSFVASIPSPEELNPPPIEAPVVGLAVRPDVAILTFSAHAPTLKEARAMIDELAVVVGSRATLRLRSLGWGIDTSAFVEGQLELALSPKDDFWARSELLLTARNSAQAVSARHKKAITVSEPEVRVRDPEKFREALVAAWAKQAHAFATAAQTPSLRVTDCDPPEDVSQVATSTDEVRLTLPIRCHLTR